MATKSIVLAATIATVSLVDSVRLSPALTCFYCSTLLRADSVPWLSRCWFLRGAVGGVPGACIREDDC